MDFNSKYKKGTDIFFLKQDKVFKDKIIGMTVFSGEKKEGEKLTYVSESENSVITYHTSNGCNVNELLCFDSLQGLIDAILTKSEYFFIDLVK